MVLRSTQNRLVSFPLLSHKQILRGPKKLILLHQQEKQGVRLKFLLSRSVTHLHAGQTHTHPHTLVRRHSHTVSSISAASQQQVSGDRGHLCARLPFFSSNPGHLCWGKIGCERGKQLIQSQLLCPHHQRNTKYSWSE